MDIFNILALQPRTNDITLTKLLLFKFVCIYLETGQNKLDALKMVGQLFKYYHIILGRESCKPLKQKKTAKDVLVSLSQIGINEHGHNINLNSFLKTFLSYK